MDKRSSLLNELRIEREAPPTPRRARPVWWLASAALVAGAAVALWRFAPPAGVPAAGAPAPARDATAGAPATSRVSTEPSSSDEARASSAQAPAAASLLDASGYVVARRKATVSSKITARVVEVLIEEGQHVEAGQVVARLDDTNARAESARAEARLAEAEATLRAAQVALADSRPAFERSRRERERAIISAQAFDDAKAAFDAARAQVDVDTSALAVARADVAVAERNLADTVVRAPFAGVVTVKAAQQGEMVSPVSAGGGFTRTGIGTIVDMDSLEVQVDVSEGFIHRVHAGQAVSIVLNAYPDWTIPGSVVAIIPTADRAKATVTVRVELGEKDARILPEMGVRVAFLREPPKAAAKDAQGRAGIPERAAEADRSAED